MESYEPTEEGGEMMGGLPEAGRFPQVVVLVEDHVGDVAFRIVRVLLAELLELLPPLVGDLQILGLAVGHPHGDVSSFVARPRDYLLRQATPSRRVVRVERVDPGRPTGRVGRKSSTRKATLYEHPRGAVVA